ncbi:response regulator [Rubellimicrobium aerolatum]|uniref:Response regulator n=1 Tax=Rubellimicrobium aerolatum TaxID=490979 RepID=A0ABW0SGR8_9RHOB|nr:response regulator [Rubellimicrobium aerolatum]MBP1807580.1 two-component system chemotaxis response regulator CheY [Rubellimicrobium aerolatum]
MTYASHLDILVADDTAVSRALLCNSLEELGFTRVRVENDGKAALHKLMQKPAHLVISDYNMPGLNGIELLRALREFQATRSIGFILVTGRSDRSLIDEGRKYALNNYLAKPFTTIGLKASIEAVFGKLA